MWPKEGRERQTAEVVVRLEVVMEAARSRPTGGAAVCSWETDMIMGGEGEKDVSVKTVSSWRYAGAHTWLDGSLNHYKTWRRSGRLVRIRCLIRNAVGKVLSKRPEVTFIKKDQAGRCQIWKAWTRMREKE